MATHPDGCVGVNPSERMPIRTVAAVISNAVGEVLLVRKRGSRIFIQPGGKFEAGEVPLDALARELREELGVAMRRDDARFLGTFEADAVNESGRRVRADAYAVQVEGDPVAQAEIEEIRWLDPLRELDVAVAPLSREHILPAWLAQRRRATP